MDAVNDQIEEDEWRVQTAWERLSSVSRPSMFEFAGGEPAFLALASAEDASHEAHDFPLDQAQHFRGIVNVPELDLRDPGWEALVQQR